MRQTQRIVYLSGALDTKQPSILRHGDNRAAIAAISRFVLQIMAGKCKSPILEGPSWLRSSNRSCRRVQSGAGRVGREIAGCKQEECHFCMRKAVWPPGTIDQPSITRLRVTGLRSGEAWRSRFPEVHGEGRWLVLSLLSAPRSSFPSASHSCG